MFVTCCEIDSLSYLLFVTIPAWNFYESDLTATYRMHTGVISTKLSNPSNIQGDVHYRLYNIIPPSETNVTLKYAYDAFPRSGALTVIIVSVPQ